MSQIEGPGSPSGNASDEGPEAAFAARLVAVEPLLASGALEEVGRILDALESELASPPLSDSPHAPALRAAAFTARGHAGRVAGRREQSVAAYARALALYQKTAPGSVRDRQFANLWTCRGLALLSSPDPAELHEAIISFDEAIALRTASTSRSDQWGLAAAWLNRADALARLGGADRLGEAIEAVTKGREALVDFDPDESPASRTRWALSWMKEGEFSARLRSECAQDCGDRAIFCLEQAVVLLRAGAAAGAEESRRMLAAALANLSRTRLLLDRKGSPTGAEEAREALAWLGEAESSSPETAGLGATARIAFACHRESLPDGDEGLLEITDFAEAGLANLAAVRKTEDPSAVDEGIVGELIRLGASAYLRAAPRFLADFLLEQLDPHHNEDHFADLAAAHEVAVRTLWKGIAEIQRSGFTGMGGEAYEARRELLADWEHCRTRLAEVRRVYFEI